MDRSWGWKIVRFDRFRAAGSSFIPKAQLTTQSGLGSLVAAAGEARHWRPVSRCLAFDLTRPAIHADAADFQAALAARYRDAR